MRLNKSIALLVVLSTPAAAETSYYQCKDKWGQPVFSERPCGEDATQGSIEGPQTSGSGQSDNATWDHIEAENAVRDAERVNTRREQRVTQLEQERDTKIATLKDRSRYANNNLAGAQYQESLATEMQAVTEQYNAKIASEEKRIDRTRDQIERVREATPD